MCGRQAGNLAFSGERAPGTEGDDREGRHRRMFPV